MKCHYHPETDGLQECRLCGHPLCGACAVEIHGAPYCRECLQSRIEQPVPAAAIPPPSDMRSPKVAGWLAVIPGLGLLYLGEYLKAFTMALIFMGAVHLADESEPGGFLVFLAWLGQIIYSVHEARRLRRSGVPEAPAPAPSPAPDKDSPLWGGILIGVGLLFLLDQFEVLSFGEIFEKFWPTLIIVLGIQILLRGRRERSPSLTS